MTLKPAFALGAEVYLRTRNERLRGLVTGLIVRPGYTAYIVAWGDASESNHFDFELADEPEIC